MRPISLEFGSMKPWIGSRISQVFGTGVPAVAAGIAVNPDPRSLPQIHAELPHPSARDPAGALCADLNQHLR